MKQRLAAILAADAAGYSRLMSVDDRATVAALDAARAIFQAHIEAHQGRVIDMAGDSVLAVFDTATGAVVAALAVQGELRNRIDGVPEEGRMRFRIGVHLGDVIEKTDGSIYGDGVNIAARLQTIAAPGGICVSDSVHMVVQGKIDAGFTYLGKRTVKNIPRPVGVHAVGAGGQPLPGEAPSPSARVRRWRRMRVAAFAIIAVVALVAAFAFSPAAPMFRDAWTRLAGKPAASETAGRPTIAVLPLTNQSGDASRDYFSNGITEDIINALGRFSGVTVISYNAVKPYKGSADGQTRISHELGVRYIAQGSVRQVEGKVRVAIELADAANGTLLWSDRVEGEGRDLFEMQDRIVRSIVGALAVNLTKLELQRVNAKPVDSMQTYDLVLRARDLLRQSDQGANRRARQLLGQAMSLTPGDAEAQVAMADAEYWRVEQGYVEDVAPALRRSEEHARKALSTDETRAHGRAHSALGRIYTLQGQYEEALAQSKLAIELNPSDAAAYSSRGSVLLYMGKFDDAIAAMETSRQLDPRGWPQQGFTTSMAYFMAGRLPEAIATTDSYAARNPGFDFLYVVRAAALAEAGRLEEARIAATQVRQLRPFFQVDQVGTRFKQPGDMRKIQEALRKAGL